MKVYFYSLNSCGMRNTVIQSYRDYLIANGHEVVNDLSDSEAVLLWTCAFRRDMRDNSLAEIKHLEESYPGKLIVAGCLPDIDRGILDANYNGIILPWRGDQRALETIFGKGATKLEDIPLVLFKNQLYKDEATYRKENPGADVPYIGRYIQIYISEGCKWECTYCSERLAFPPYRSFNEDQIVATVAEQVALQNSNKIVLLGDSVGDYGSDTGSSLPNLIRRIRATVPDIKIAMQDFNPYFFLKFYDDMIEFINAGLIVHLQMPYQSASDRILQLMERPYSRADLNKIFNTINELKFTELDSHIIVGFPGETEEDFERSVQFAIQYRPKYMLINCFMESPGMPAANLPGKIDPEVKRRRSQEAEARFKAAGILCNCDDSEYARDRFQKMDLSKHLSA